MICGALQTLNEEAFEDVVASERPSPTGGPSTGETIALTPIQETVEHERSLACSNDGTTDRLQLHTISFSTNISSLNSNSNSNNNSHNISLSYINRGDTDNNNHPNSMVMADLDNTNHNSNNLNKIANNLSGLNVHESMSSQSQSQLPLSNNPTSSSSFMLEHESIPIDHSNDNNHTTISITIPTQTPPNSTIILMPDAKVTANKFKASIDDTRL